MRRRIRLLSALAAGTLAFVVGTSTAHAILSGTQYPCQVAIAKEGLKFVKGKIKLQQKCINSSPAAETACSAEALTKLRSKLRAGLAKKCTFLFNNSDRTTTNLASIGFPGPCPNPDATDGFTLLDLQNCIEASHEAIITGGCAGGTNAGQVCATLNDCPDTSAGTFCRRGLGGCWGGDNTGEPCSVLADCPDQSAGTGCRLALGMRAVEYDPTFPTLTGTALTCQQAIAKNSVTFVAAVMKAVQKCRNDLLNCKIIPNTTIVTCKLSGILPKDCATGDEKTKAAIDKAKAKANTAIASKCLDADMDAINACDPDQLTGALTARCEVDSHQALTDNPYPTAPPDFLDYEYPQRGFCGNNQKDQPNEECDGVDDSACVGLCGAASGLFPCLCTNIPRTRVVEHANADLDNGWTGQSHDSGIVEGGGYVTDLWDCDGPGGPDTICHVGPTCELGLQEPCSPQGYPKPSDLPLSTLDTGDKICAAKIPPQGKCRKTEGGATGPHCELDFQQRCINDVKCKTIPGDRCVFVPHGAPLPISSGGVSVCIVNTFSEDVVGTTNLSLTSGPNPGGGAVRLRQHSTTYLGPDQEQPCPVCGGFCSGSGSSFSPGTRNLCSSNADCNGGTGTCITDLVCSWGARIDKPCNPNTPTGGTTEFFGNPSADCQVGQGTSLLSSPPLDILFNPATTGSATPLTTSIDCGTEGWNGKVCVGGSNQHEDCSVDADCTGGTCNEQCFCVGGEQKPNACDPACLGGTNDRAPCAVDSECPDGFCHRGDCRLNTPPDMDSSQEGICTVGPFDGRCSVHTFKTCPDNAGCGPVLCPFCDPGETCLQVNRECFVNPTITRAGKPAVSGPNDHDRTTAATFCIPKTSAPSVNSTAGLPGPGAITTIETITEVGF